MNEQDFLPCHICIQFPCTNTHFQTGHTRTVEYGPRVDSQFSSFLTMEQFQRVRPIADQFELLESVRIVCVVRMSNVAQVQIQDISELK